MSQLVAAPIRCSARPEQVRELLKALGGTDAAEDVVALDAGLVQVEEVPETDCRAGETHVAFGVAGDEPATPSRTFPDGVTVLARQLQSLPRCNRGLSVMPIWYTDQPETAVSALTQMGLQPRLASDSGVWTDFVCPGGGLAGVHAAETSEVELGFELDGDLDGLAASLRAKGIAATIVDEAYTRVIHVPDPDGGPDWQINHRQTDTYGFSHLTRG